MFTNTETCSPIIASAEDDAAEPSEQGGDDADIEDNGETDMASST